MLTRYERSGASSRLRLIQYAGPLGLQGISSSLQPFFDDSYLRRLYSGRSTLAPTSFAYARRVGQLLRAGQVDLIWLEKEALPWLPWGLERALLSRAVPLVVDYDDAVFHRYDLHRSPFVQRLLGRKLDKLMASASLVTAGTSYLADRATAAGARRVEIVPTVVDVDSYSVRSQDSPRPARIGWIGSPSTWAEYLAPMMPLLLDVMDQEGGRVTAVGAGQSARSHPLFDSLPWSEDTEIAQIQGMDIGIMPLTDTPWARGKCGYKLIQYMACGLPVVASPVGVNAEIVEHGVNGFLARTEDEWRDALVTLLRDPDLRRRMGAEGRRKVETQYSLQVWGPRVAGMLKGVAEGRRS